MGTYHGPRKKLLGPVIKFYPFSWEVIIVGTALIFLQLLQHGHKSLYESIVFLVFLFPCSGTHYSLLEFLCLVPSLVNELRMLFFFF